jgi:hypothetical protein
MSVEGVGVGIEGVHVCVGVEGVSICPVCACRSRRNVLPSPQPWDFPPSIDRDISRKDSPMELDEPEGVVSLD